MNFELGKEYIVTVTDKGIIPIDEFNREKFYDKDNDDLDFLTDEEKEIVVNELLDKIKAEIDLLSDSRCDGTTITIYSWNGMKRRVLEIIDKYRSESDDMEVVQ